jgi:hypothetical protein
MASSPKSKITRLPGFKLRGEQLSAEFGCRLDLDLYTCWIDYDQLNDSYFGPIFSVALERAGGTTLGDELNELSAQNAPFVAKFVSQGWDYAYVSGLSLKMTRELRKLLLERYQAARELYDSWEVPDWPDPDWEVPLPQIEHWEMYGSGRDDYEY